MRQTTSARPWLPLVLLACGPLAVLAGLLLHRMWGVLPWERLALSLLLAGLAATLAWPLKRFARLDWAAALAAVWLGALVLFVGPLPVASTLLLGAAALALGWSLTPAGLAARAAVATALGLVMIAGVTGWLLRLPLHFAWVWLPLLLGVLLLRRHALREALRGIRAGFTAATRECPRWAAASMMLLGLVSTACWIPTMQVDDLAYHLGLPAQLLAHGRYQPDPMHQVWSLAPWAGDVLQGIAAVLARDDARGAVNALWLVVAAGCAWSLAASLGARPLERWGALALFASFPPLVWMAAGMQTELPATAVLLAMAAAVAGAGRRWLVPAAILFAGLAALKTIHALSAMPLAIYALWRYRDALRWQHLPLALGIGLVFGGSSYLQSWWATGNPVLPLFNHLFASPYFPVEAYIDARWRTGFGPGLLWTTAFDTPRHVEAFNGGLGFTPLALAGAWLLALLRPERRGLALAVSLVAVLPLVPLQYLRYAYPGLLLLGVFLVIRSEPLLGARTLGLGLAALCLLNLAFQANAGWTHHSSALKRVIRGLGDPTQVLPHYVPERRLIARLPPGDDGIVLATDPQRTYIAELGLRGRGVIDHAPGLAAAYRQAEADPSGAAWEALLTDSRARWVLLVPATASPALMAGLARRGGTQVDTEGDATMWRLPEAEVRHGSRAP